MKNNIIKGIYINCLICEIKLYSAPWEQRNNKKYCSRKCQGISKIGKPINIGEKNGQWKNKPGMSALHEWVKKRLIKPQTCRDCNQSKKLDLANISQKYKRNLTDWEWLCRSCHMKKEERRKHIGEWSHNHRRKSYSWDQPRDKERII